MRISLLFTVAALLSLQTSAQTCPNSNTLCPATPISVPNPWFALDFSTDPRQGATSYNWITTAPNDPCSAFHSGMVDFQGSTNRSFNLGPHINLAQATGPYSAGQVLPGNIGGTSQGSFAEGTKGWSLEVTFRANQEGDRTQWAKVVDLGSSSQQVNGRCNGEWLVGWQDNTDDLSMGTCVNGDEHKIERFLVDAPDNTWMHVTSVIQYSPNGWTTYSVYYNGQLMKTREDSNPLVNMVRDRPFLGRATWDDAYFNGTIDHFAIYDIALTPSMVRGNYGQRMNGCQVTRAAYANGTLATGTVTAAYSVDFATNVTTIPGVPADFAWVDLDPEDASCGLTNHRGMLSLAGNADWTPSISAGQYVNLSASTGENWIGGQPMPVFGNVTAGQGTIADRTAGFSIEVSFKSAFQNPYSKIFALGNAASTACQTGDMWAGWRASDFGLEVMYCDNNGATRTIVSRSVPLRVRTWHHLILAVAAQDNGLATWSVFLDGNVVAVVGNQYMPGAIQRRSNLLGRSLYFGGTDTYWSGLIDKFVVYPRALSSTQAASLSTVAVIASCPQQTNSGTAIPSTFFQAAWSTDPRPNAANYGWLLNDNNDTPAVQALHQGMITLGQPGTRNSGQFVNLTATTGPNSATGVSLGVFGGEGSGDFIRGTKGWTFETVFKIYNVSGATFNATTGNILRNGQDWAKVFDMGDGNKGSNRDQCENDVIWGFSGGDPYMRFEVCNTVNYNQLVGTTAQRPMKTNVWYHVVQTVQLVPQGSQASLYIDGQLVESILIRTYPLLTTRQDARLGSSSWPNDPTFSGAIDLFSIYSQAVNQQQVNAMFARANGGAAPSSTGSNQPTSSSTNSPATSTPSQTSTQLPTSSPTDPNGETGGEGGNGAASLSMSIMSIMVVVVAAVLSM